MLSHHARHDLSFTLQLFPKVLHHSDRGNTTTEYISTIIKYITIKDNRVRQRLIFLVLARYSVSVAVDVLPMVILAAVDVDTFSLRLVNVEVRKEHLVHRLQ